MGSGDGVLVVRENQRFSPRGEGSPGLDPGKKIFPVDIFLSGVPGGKNAGLKTPLAKIFQKMNSGEWSTELDL